MVDVSGQIKATRLLHRIITEMEQQACALVDVKGHRRPLPGLEVPTGHRRAAEADTDFLSLRMSMVDVSGQIKDTRLLNRIITEMEQQTCALVLVEGHRRPLPGLEASTGHKRPSGC